MIFNHQVNNAVGKMNEIELRLRCAEIAASLTNDHGLLIRLADEIYKFITGVVPSRPPT